MESSMTEVILIAPAKSYRHQILSITHMKLILIMVGISPSIAFDLDGVLLQER